MKSTIFRQYDSRWGSLPYPTRNSSFAGNGCGCCAVTHIAIENPKYAKLTPKDVRKYMVQYAVTGKGTLWSGIPAGMNKYRAIDVKSGLERYGYSEPVHIGESDPMSKAFEYMKKGYTMGIILFSKGYGGTTSRTYWTAGGHYIAFTGVRNLTSKDAEMYMKDSGGRCHDGWYSYLRSMKGVVFQMWLVKPIKTDSKFPAETLKKGSQGAEVKKWQKYLNTLGYGLTVDGDFGKLTETATKDFQKKTGLKVDGIVGTKTVAKAKATKKLPKKKTEREQMVDDMLAFAKKYADDNRYTYKKWTSDANTHKCPVCHPDSGKGWNCIGFATAICYHGGGMKHLRCSCSGLGNDAWFTQVLAQAKKSTKTALNTWTKRNGTNWEIVWNDGKKLTTAQLQAGDVCLAYSGDTYKHTFVYAGNGYIYDSTSGKTQISKRKYSALGITTKIAFRPTGRKG